jgi:SnoaL-like domain
MEEGPDVLWRIHAEHAIRNVIQRYCRAVDRCDWDLLRSVYHERAFDDHGAYKGDVAGFILWVAKRHASIAMSMHFVTNCLVDVIDSSHARAETYCMALQRSVAGVDPWRPADAQIGCPADAVFEMRALCRYLDQFERRGESWAITHRVVACEDTMVTQRSGEPVFPDGAVVSRRSRQDYLYTLLSPVARRLGE